MFLNENFTIKSNFNLFEIENLVSNQYQNGCIISHFDQSKMFSQMKLSSDAIRIFTTPNAGGNSIQSEVLSFEFFKKYCNAHLLKTELEVEYWPCGGSINDYVMYVFDTVIGVSVTRAMKFPFEDIFTVDDALYLLSKKLKGINRSSRNTLIKWDKQILHVWTMNEQTAESITAAWYDELDVGMKSNTVLLITVATKSVEIFLNKGKYV